MHDDPPHKSEHHHDPLLCRFLVAIVPPCPLQIHIHRENIRHKTRFESRQLKDVLWSSLFARTVTCRHQNVEFQLTSCIR